MRGKRVPDMLRSLAALEPIPVFTRGRRSGARSPRRAARRAGTRSAGVAVAPPPMPGRHSELAAGLRRSPDQPVVVAGSLYLVGAVRAMLAGEEAAA